jgi:hypothetical protein
VISPSALREVAITRLHGRAPNLIGPERLETPAHFPTPAWIIARLLDPALAELGSPPCLPP